MRNLSVRLLAIATSLLLFACGGEAEPDAKTAAPTSPAVTTLSLVNHSPLSDTTQPPADLSAQKAASRFLSQATFGASMADIEMVAMVGRNAWLENQFYRPQTLHRTELDQMASTLAPGGKLQQIHFFHSFWKQALSKDDLLRQRVTFALSQIFVISFENSVLTSYPRGAAAYYDTLGQHAFGNYRDLLEAVAKHPMMGLYLSSMGNKKESDVALPDENFAREIMQLFSIGLYQLNPDGSLRYDAQQKPIETYSHDDIVGIARALTGWSWAGPDKTERRFIGITIDPDRDWLPMQHYPQYHSSSDKNFLGVEITGSTSGEADMKRVLDTLFAHPNVGPFIGRQLIQRLVTSNPSPQYVARVAAAFANNGQGVRGDMKAVWRAILLDPEALEINANPQYPARKLREPLVRQVHWARAFNASSSSGQFLVGNMDDPMTGLGQNVLRSPSVFNFFRPGYTPPNTTLAEAGMVAPEMQTTGEISVAGYLNHIMHVIPQGLGIGSGVRDVLPNYSAELALANNPELLLDRIDLLLTHGNMSTTLRQQILSALNAVKIPLDNGSNAEQIAQARANRVYLSIFLTMAAPEYIVQK